MLSNILFIDITSALLQSTFIVIAELHDENANPPIDITELGISIVVNDVHE